MLRRESLPAAPFQRQCAGAAFRARQGLSPRADVAPPGRVLDLRAAGPGSGSGPGPGSESGPGDGGSTPPAAEDFVRLEWTAPGGDYDQGKGKNQDAKKKIQLQNAL